MYWLVRALVCQSYCSGFQTLKSWGWFRVTEAESLGQECIEHSCSNIFLYMECRIGIMVFLVSVSSCLISGPVIVIKTVDLG
jgi:hypothetical protein